MTSADHDSFLALLDTHQGILHKVANAYSWTPEDRQDLVQDMLVQLWRAHPRFDGRCKFSTWMYRIALNVALSFRRQESLRAAPLLPGDAHLETVVEAPPPPAEQAFLQRFIQGLPGLDRALLLLYLEDQGQQEIAEVLGLSPTHVSTKIHRLKQRLRDAASQGGPHGIR